MHIEFAYCVKVKDWLFCQDWRHSFWSEISLSTFFVFLNHHNKDFLTLNLTYGCFNDSVVLAILYQEDMWIKDLHRATGKKKSQKEKFNSIYRQTKYKRNKKMKLIKKSK